MENKTQNTKQDHIDEIDFLAWRVMRARDRHHQKDVNRILSERPRRRPTRH